MVLLDGWILWPNTGAFHTVYDNILILFKEFIEFRGGRRQALRDHPELFQGASEHRQQLVRMGMGVSAAEPEMETQHIEGGIGFKVIQDEEQFLFDRIQITFGTPLLDLLDFAPFNPFPVDFQQGRFEGFHQGGEFRFWHSNQGSDNAVVGDIVELFVNH